MLVWNGFLSIVIYISYYDISREYLSKPGKYIDRIQDRLNDLIPGRVQAMLN